MAKDRKPSRPRRNPRITVTELDDLSEQDRSAYGRLFVAKVGDWQSSPRSTEARATTEAEAYLGTLEPVEDGS